MQVSEFNLTTAVTMIGEHFATVKEPQHKSIFIMRLFQVSIEIIRPKEATDIVYQLFTANKISKQQIRRALVRLFWRFDDIITDYPKGYNVLGQILAYLKLRKLITGKVATQIPEEIREILYKVDSFNTSFAQEKMLLTAE